METDSFTTDMIQKFVTATNNFAVVIRIKDWKPIPVDEFYLGTLVLFLNLLVTMFGTPASRGVDL